MNITEKDDRLRNPAKWSHETMVIHDSKPFLTALAQASQTLDIISIEDIIDANGVRLVSGGQKLTVQMQVKLADRVLAKPLEASIDSNGGVTCQQIAGLATSLCQGSTFLAALMGNEFATIKKVYLTLSLPPFAHLMLSVLRLTHPQRFEHAVLCSLIAGAFAARSAGQRNENPATDTQLAVLAGLLHDLGELYGPDDRSTPIAGADRHRWRAVVAHVNVGKRLVEQFTDYPEPVAQAIAEHHEKLDGSGYPRGISGDAMSPLGRILSLADTICGIIQAADNHWARAKLALSFVSGEFDPQLVRQYTEVTHGTIAAEITLPPAFDLDMALDHARTMSKSLARAGEEIARLAQENPASTPLGKIVALTQHRIDRLKSAWEATGIDAYCVAESSQDRVSQMDEESFFDLEVVSRELTWRMRSQSRQVMLLLDRYRLEDKGTLEPVISALELGI
ncbi:MAG: HD domain-containing phosphohydrolase [Pseudomonadales bacterium]|nr:HD domain-containing phosphohydrolase [Pseudomonadales bacterium]